MARFIRRVPGARQAPSSDFSPHRQLPLSTTGVACTSFAIPNGRSGETLDPTNQQAAMFAPPNTRLRLPRSAGRPPAASFSPCPACASLGGSRTTPFAKFHLRRSLTRVHQAIPRMAVDEWARDAPPGGMHLNRRSRRLRQRNARVDNWMDCRGWEKQTAMVYSVQLSPSPPVVFSLTSAVATFIPSLLLSVSFILFPGAQCPFSTLFTYSRPLSPASPPAHSGTRFIL